MIYDNFLKNIEGFEGIIFLSILEYVIMFKLGTHFGFTLTVLAHRQLGGLVVKTLACCAGGPGFDPWVENPKFSKDLHQQNPSWMLFR